MRLGIASLTLVFVLGTWSSAAAGEKQAPPTNGPAPTSAPSAAPASTATPGAALSNCKFDASVARIPNVNSVQVEYLRRCLEQQTAVMALNAAERKDDVAYNQRYNDALMKREEIAERIYDAQNWKSVLILLAVLLLVLAGLAFSVVQLWFSFMVARELRKASKNVSADDETEASIASKTAEGKVTVFKIGKDGIEVQSATLGVVVLVISIVFFYLYLQTVYSITVAPS